MICSICHKEVPKRKRVSNLGEFPERHTNQDGRFCYGFYREMVKKEADY